MRRLDDGRRYRSDLMPPHVYLSYKALMASTCIRYVTRYHLTVACQMNFRQYPIDVQKCHLEFTQRKF